MRVACPADLEPRIETATEIGAVSQERVGGCHTKVRIDGDSVLIACSELLRNMGFDRPARGQ